MGYLLGHSLVRSAGNASLLAFERFATHAWTESAVESVG